MSTGKKVRGLEEPAAAYASNSAHGEVGSEDAAVTVKLSHRHHTWALERVAAGAFKTPDEAIAWALDHYLPVADDEDDSWVIPYLEEARRDLDAGRFVSGDEVQAKLKRRVQRLRAKSGEQT
jgi:predicted transcriptional regulator